MSRRYVSQGRSVDVTDQRDAMEDLGRSESRFRRLLDSGILGVYEGSESGEILEGNDAFLRMLGYSREDLTAGLIRWDRLAVPGYEQLGQQIHAQLIAHGASSPAEVEYFRKDGSRLPALIGLASLGADGSRAIGFIFDLTQQSRAQEALRKSEEKFRQLAEHIREVFWMMDNATAEILYVSPAYEQIWGRKCESLYADPPSWLNSIHPNDREDAVQTFRRQVEGEIVTNEYRIVQPSGAIRWIRDRAFPIRDASGDIIRLAGVAEDMTDRKHAELQLVHHAQYDELTDLPNRRQFRQQLKQATDECTEGKCGAVFFIDLDQFKLVNDTLGYLEGDRLLKDIALRLFEICRKFGTLARFGGDEFTFVGTNFEGPGPIRDLGNEMITCFKQPFRVADREVFIDASIGISMFPEHGTDPFILKRNADLAMHEARRIGKNQVFFFTEGLVGAALERLELQTRLRRALEMSEFKLQFQPQFTLGKSRPSRFEALIRWFPPGGDLIPPSKFIPVAEETGLIIPIGAWVLHEACTRCVEWQSGPLQETGVAVNVSALQFACPDFVDVVAGVLRSTGLPPRLLELELTESVLVRDARASASTLTKLRDLGVTIALDDFGTGYSSLSYLQNLPIDRLKIDRSFLNQAESRPKAESVMRCVVELAHALGLRVIGEGVETVPQLNLLHRLGCDEAQGFLLGRPSFDVDWADSAFNPQRDPSGNVRELALVLRSENQLTGSANPIGASPVSGHDM